MKVSVPQEVLIQDVGGESVLLNLASEQYFGLDDVGTRMWTTLVEKTEVEAAYKTLLAEYDVEPEQLRRDLQQLIQKLVDHGLLSVTEEQSGTSSER
ncbi:MAG: PqqD family protein [Cyanophyceae cyanobacterium]